MGERSLFGRGFVLAITLSAAGAVGAGCADGNTTPVGRRDAGNPEAGMDMGVPDTGPRPDTGPDVGTDANLPDTGVDAGPIVGTCEACTTDANCDPTSYCAMLASGGRACLPGCDSEFPMCPRGFTCIFDATGTGVHANICAPVGGPCCVDEDNDMYGVGVGCMGPDCNDNLATVHPGRDEICDGIDTNCNAHVDEDPNDCMSGRCSADGDGTYSSIMGATCHLAACTSGTTTDCALYTCHDGGAMGTTCATMCAPTGTDDDRFCILTAHCDTGACVADVVPGGTCDEDSDCSTSHCENGFCCGTGTCCSVTSDCPGGGAVTAVCDDPTNCQGHHGTLTCVSNQCTAMSGIDDDTACNSTVTAHDCGTYNPVVCNGMLSQVGRACPTSCIGDADCVAAAHCSSGFCLPDLPPGVMCSRTADCMTGLNCVDGVCCTSACNGQCQACNLAGMEGTCAPVMAGADPAGECAGFTCASYYTGFSGGSDVCQIRQPVSDAEATCDGGGHCRTPATLCPLQLPGATQIDCNNTCQRPHPGTCTGMTAGSCDNLDATAGTMSCGMGACVTTVPACIGGVPQMCSAGAGSAEVCDGVDNNCNGTVDDGGAALCGNPGHVMTSVCNGGAGCAIASMGCAAGYADYDGSFGTGCECDLTGGGATCSAPHNFGSIAVGNTASATASLGPGQSSWFLVTFTPSAAPAARGGTPTIQVSPPGIFNIHVYSNCSSSTYSCQEGGGLNSGSAGIFSYQMADSVGNSPSGYTSAATTWPTTAYIEVVRTSVATTCLEAQFTLTISR